MYFLKIKKTRKPQGPFVCIDILQFFLQKRNKIVFKTMTFSIDTRFTIIKLNFFSGSWSYFQKDFNTLKYVLLGYNMNKV